MTAFTNLNASRRCRSCAAEPHSTDHYCGCAPSREQSAIVTARASAAREAKARTLAPSCVTPETTTFEPDAPTRETREGIQVQAWVQVPNNYLN